MRYLNENKYDDQLQSFRAFTAEQKRLATKLDQVTKRQQAVKDQLQELGWQLTAEAETIIKVLPWTPMTQEDKEIKKQIRGGLMKEWNQKWLHFPLKPGLKLDHNHLEHDVFEVRYREGDHRSLDFMLTPKVKAAAYEPGIRWQALEAEERYRVLSYLLDTYPEIFEGAEMGFFVRENNYQAVAAYLQDLGKDYPGLQVIDVKLSDEERDALLTKIEALVAKIGTLSLPAGKVLIEKRIRGLVVRTCYGADQWNRCDFLTTISKAELQDIWTQIQVQYATELEAAEMGFFVRENIITWEDNDTLHNQIKAVLDHYQVSALTLNQAFTLGDKRTVTVKRLYKHAHQYYVQYHIGYSDYITQQYEEEALAEIRNYRWSKAILQMLQHLYPEYFEGSEMGFFLQEKHEAGKEELISRLMLMVKFFGNQAIKLSNNQALWVWPAGVFDNQDDTLCYQNSQYHRLGPKQLTLPMLTALWSELILMFPNWESKFEGREMGFFIKENVKEEATDKWMAAIVTIRQVMTIVKREPIHIKYKDTKAYDNARDFPSPLAAMCSHRRIGRTIELMPEVEFYVTEIYRDYNDHLVFEWWIQAPPVFVTECILKSNQDLFDAQGKSQPFEVTLIDLPRRVITKIADQLRQKYVVELEAAEMGFFVRDEV